MDDLTNKKCLLSIDCVPQGKIEGGGLAVWVEDKGLPHGGVILCVPDNCVVNVEDGEVERYVDAMLNQTKCGSELIAAERTRQLIREGYTASHDDGHISGELAQAAEAYLRAYTLNRQYFIDGPPLAWPFEKESFKWDIDDPVKGLIKAGALIAAEIDRVLRGAVNEIA